jgi:hypothetical protein
MAVGDVKSAIVSVAAGDYLDIQPPTGEEWVIHKCTICGAQLILGVNWLRCDFIRNRHRCKACVNKASREWYRKQNKEFLTCFKNMKN